MLTVGPIAHALIDRELRIVALDSAYRAILGLTDDAIGATIMDFVHPAERDAAAPILQWILEGGDGRYLTQRHLRADGSLFMAHLYISGIGSGDARQLMITCRPLPASREGPSPVEAQWQMARLLLKAIDSGKLAFGESLIGNPATELLLLTYVAEAEARTVRAGDLATRIAVSWPLAQRWLIALDDAGFVECELPGPIEPHSPVRLTPRALAMIEAIFGALVAVIQGSLVPA